MRQQAPLIVVSLVIPTLNRATILLDTLQYIKAQGFKRHEVLVIDQSTEFNDEAQALLSSFNVPSRYCHVNHFRGLPQARNYGLSLAKGEIVLYIDDDIRCGPDFVQAHYDAHLKTGASVVAGGIKEAKGDVTQRGATGSFNWWTASPTRNYHLKKPGWVLHAPGGNFSIKKSVVSQLGGFDEILSIGAALYEETELGLRVQKAGFRCWFAPEAHLIHLAAPMGGCRVQRDIPRYVFGMAHNRAILIFRHLKPWHRPTALCRMLLYGLSYSREDRSLRPFFAAVRGLIAGQKASISIQSNYLQPVAQA